MGESQVLEEVKQPGRTYRPAPAIRKNYFFSCSARQIRSEVDGQLVDPHANGVVDGFEDGRDDGHDPPSLTSLAAPTRFNRPA